MLADSGEEELPTGLASRRVHHWVLTGNVMATWELIEEVFSGDGAKLKIARIELADKSRLVGVVLKDSNSANRLRSRLRKKAQKEPRKNEPTPILGSRCPSALHAAFKV